MQPDNFQRLVNLQNDSLNNNSNFLCNTEEIGSWYYAFKAETIVFSDYLYEFYELEKNFSSEKLQSIIVLYVGSQRKRLIENIELSIRTVCEIEDVYLFGNTKWHSIVISPLINKNNEVIVLHGIVKSVTLDFHEQSKLLSNISSYDYLNFNQRQIKAIDNAMDGIALLDNEGTYYYLNNSHVRIFGYQDQQELIGKKWHCLYNENEIARIDNEIFPILFQNKYWQGYTEGKKKDNSPILQEISLTLLEDGGIICICRDISLDKKKEIELQRLAIVAEKTNSLVLIANRENRLIWTNISFRKILGFTATEVNKLTLVSFLYFENISKKSFRLIYNSLKISGVYAGEIEFTSRDKNKIFLYVNITAIWNEKGIITDYIFVGHDITATKNAERQLVRSLEKERELNQLKTLFINLVSHQFRTPLATIKTCMDVLDMKFKLDDIEIISGFFYKYKNIIDRESKRMVKLLENILELGKIDESKIELYKQEINFKEFFDKFIEELTLTEANGRKLNYFFNAPVFFVYCDVLILTNILENVISNAFKYSADRRNPELIVTYDEFIYCIKIKDYGIGIPENDKDFIFQSFFRASNVRNIEGSGLGLLIAKKLALAHGWNFFIESSINEGTLVTLELPI